MKVSVEVPFNCSAILKLPLAPKDVLKDKDNPMFADVRDDMCYLQPGIYTVSYQLSETLKKTYDLDMPMWKLKAEPEVVEKLKGILDLTKIKEEYMGHSVQEYLDMFKRLISQEQIEQIEAVLAECE